MKTTQEEPSLWDVLDTDSSKELTRESGEDLILNVHEFLESLNELISPLKTLIQGEVQSVNIRGNGVYFTLTDTTEQALLNCVIWKTPYQRTGVELKEGMEVQIQGYPQIYKPYGKLTFMTNRIIPIGEGALKEAFERLKRQLEELGYFDQARKRPLPPFIKTIALLTSEYGDARNDFLTHLGNHGIRILFHDVRVEGVQSVSSVVNAIHTINHQFPEVEAIILTRGGGSLESLQAFNSVEVAEAIFTSRIPVISAIGHENDISIADMVADLRASTPTHAGKILAEPWDNLKQQISGYEVMLLNSIRSTTHRLKHTFETFEQRSLEMFTRNLHRFQERLRMADQILQLSNPTRLLEKGYSISRTANGDVIRSIHQVKQGDTIHVQVTDGKVETKAHTITHS